VSPEEEALAGTLAELEGERYELVAGEVVAMAPERLGHARVKHQVARCLEDAIAAAGLRCEALPDGVSVEIDEHTTYEPDALVRCGERLPDDTVKLSDPVIVVEVLPPSTRARDAGAKLEDYFRLASVRHYLIVKTDSRSVIHHRRDKAGEIGTRILRGGRLELDPPGRPGEVEASFS
jgi:Uma2 family endonuclease